METAKRKKRYLHNDNNVWCLRLVFVFCFGEQGFAFFRCTNYARVCVAHMNDLASSVIRSSRTNLASCLQNLVQSYNKIDIDQLCACAFASSNKKTNTLQLQSQRSKHGRQLLSLLKGVGEVSSCALACSLPRTGTQITSDMCIWYCPTGRPNRWLRFNGLRSHSTASHLHPPRRDAHMHAHCNVLCQYKHIQLRMRYAQKKQTRKSLFYSKSIHNIIIVLVDQNVTADQNLLHQE